MQNTKKTTEKVSQLNRSGIILNIEKELMLTHSILHKNQYFQWQLPVMRIFFYTLHI